ncbi:glycogen-binding subunit 76A [Zophobas morio]|uniref:glycogen-binding subunit 76A n=1 Tax=Zophobas morio TaxID=2755281 RepID=UPI003082C1C5
MTSGEDNCNLNSLLSMSCRQRAEAFANRLHSRLTSLDSKEKNIKLNENSWLSTSNDTLTVSQPKPSCDYTFTTDFYLNFVTSESPGEELDDTEHLNSIINAASQNKDGLPQHVITSHYDSDSSDGPFYDCQSDFSLFAEDICNGSATCVNNVCNEPTANTDGEIISGKSPKYNIFNQEDMHIADGVFQEKNENCDDTSIYDSKLELNKDRSQSSNIEKEAIFQTENLFASVSNDHNEIEEKIPRVRRCSSLKTGKTPPETPGRKKIVRFADVLGLDLADVRTFLDEIPKIPNSAFNDLMDVDVKTSSSSLSSTSSQKQYSTQLEKVLVPLFSQPGGQPDFMDRIRDNQICLDNVIVEDSAIPTFKGLVRVKNLDFHKTVHVRYTVDSWKSFADVQAIYVENSCDGFSDKFCFTIYGNNLALGDKLEFAIRFQCKGCQFWDNNNGKNYSLQCLPTTTSTNAAPDSKWTSYFY